MVYRDIPTDKEKTNSIMARNSNYGSNILCWMEWKYLHSFLDYLVYMVYSSINCQFLFFIIACQTSTGSLWITFYVIAVQPTTIIRGLVKIKYTRDPTLFTSLNPLMLLVTKWSHILKQIYSLQLQVYSSMCDLFVTTSH